MQFSRDVPPRPRLPFALPTLRSVSLTETAETRLGRYSLRSPLPRIECEVDQTVGTATPLLNLSLCAAAGIKARLQLRCSLVPHCAPESAPCCISQAQEPLCSLSPHCRNPLRRTLGNGFPAVSRLSRRPIRRPDEVRHNSVLCPRKRRACHRACIPDLALVGARPTCAGTAPVSPAVLMPSA